MYNIDYNILLYHIPTNIDIGKTLKEVENPNLILNEYSDKNQDINIYTDASKIAGAKSVGCACICKELGTIIQESLPITASIFTAECFALKEALNIVISKPQSNYNIITVSLSAVTALNSNKIDPNVNPYIISVKRKYHEIKEKANIDI